MGKKTTSNTRLIIYKLQKYMKMKYMNKLITYIIILIVAPLCSFAGWEDLTDSSKFPPEEGSPLAVLIAFGHAAANSDLDGMKAFSTGSCLSRLNGDPNAVSKFKKSYGAYDWNRPIFYEIEMNDETAKINLKVYPADSDELRKMVGVRFSKIDGVWKLK
jgi:hypothetical protein